MDCTKLNYLCGLMHPPFLYTLAGSQNDALSIVSAITIGSLLLYVRGHPGQTRHRTMVKTGDSFYFSHQLYGSRHWRCGQKAFECTEFRTPSQNVGFGDTGRFSWDNIAIASEKVSSGSPFPPASFTLPLGGGDGVGLQDLTQISLTTSTTQTRI